MKYIKERSIFTLNLQAISFINLIKQINVKELLNDKEAKFSEKILENLIEIIKKGKVISEDLDDIFLKEEFINELNTYPIKISHYPISGRRKST